MIERIRDYAYRAEALLGSVLFAFLILLSLQVTTEGGKSLFRHIVYRGVAPLLTLGDAVYRGVGRLANDYFAFRGVVKENEGLRERLRQLELERLRLDFDVHDYALLRALVDYRAALPLTTEIARVIARDLEDPYRMLVINRGSRHGIEPDMAVLSPEGVVGRVVIVSLRTSQVQLVTDSQSALAAIHLSSGEQVLLRGEGADLLRAFYLSRDVISNPGDWMVSAGLEGIYVRGYGVGRVDRVGEEDGRRVVWVKPSAPISKLTAVLVVTERPESAP